MNWAPTVHIPKHSTQLLYHGISHGGLVKSSPCKHIALNNSGKLMESQFVVVEVNVVCRPATLEEYRFDCSANSQDGDVGILRTDIGCNV